MASSSTYDALQREHPAYRAGYLAGVDVGTRMALDVITAERGRLHQLPDTACREFADGRLRQVAAIVGASFRQAAS